MFIFVLKQHRSTHAPRLSGVSPVSPSVPEILEGYVSTIAEPFKVFKCYPPSNCLSKKWYFFCFLGGDCGFFGRVGFKIVIGSIFGISWPASAATNFAFNKGTCNKMSKRPTPMRKGIPFKKNRYPSTKDWCFWRCFFIGWTHHFWMKKQLCHGCFCMASLPPPLGYRQIGHDF